MGKRRLLFVFLFLVAAACGGEPEPVNRRLPPDPKPSSPETTISPTRAERPYVSGSDVLDSRWVSERGRARFGPRNGPRILEVRCEAGNEDLVISRSLPLGQDDELAMTITAGEARVVGLWRGVSDNVERGVTRIPAAHPIVDAMTTAGSITFQAEGFADIITPNSTVLQAVTRRCAAAG
ncbi:hypothetical protein [Parvularcula maris]|uniref:Uncharacterized protein n=1 Tax=Parvularcula maris TaxID=2965077 RepID=A0A9X2L9B1_9PROT|nr:hypothetical protein [Parvularcula maris]MCQ8185455.1 hypothetical protein [Parvularcula maris]